MSFCGKYKVPEEVGNVVYKTGSSANHGINGSGSLSKDSGGDGGPSVSHGEASVCRLIMSAKQIHPTGSFLYRALQTFELLKDFLNKINNVFRP